MCIVSQEIAETGADPSLQGGASGAAPSVSGR